MDEEVFDLMMSEDHQVTDRSFQEWVLIQTRCDVCLSTVPTPMPSFHPHSSQPSHHVLAGSTIAFQPNTQTSIITCTTMNPRPHLFRGSKQRLLPVRRVTPFNFVCPRHNSETLTRTEQVTTKNRNVTPHRVRLSWQTGNPCFWT